MAAVSRDSLLHQVDDYMTMLKSTARYQQDVW